MKRQLTEEQKRKSEERKERFKKLVKQVAAMSEADRVTLAGKMPGLITCEGHPLSFRNTMLIALQRPDSTVVGGFRQWLKQGRCVKKGEHGATIAIPCGKSKDKDGAAGDGGEGGAESDVWFSSATVFDISQTVEIGKEEQETEQAPEPQQTEPEPVKPQLPVELRVLQNMGKLQIIPVGFTPAKVEKKPQPEVAPVLEMEVVEPEEKPAKPAEEKPEYGKQYSLFELSKTGSWAKSEVKA